MEYVVITESRKRNEILFMVDRSKQKQSFWSNRLDDVFIYQKYDEALEKKNLLKYNNPKVIPLREAKKIEQEQIKRDLYNYAESMNDDSLIRAGMKS